jgi:hypothetical protein
MKQLLKFSNYALLFVAGGIFHKAITYGDYSLLLLVAVNVLVSVININKW